MVQRDPDPPEAQEDLAVTVAWHPREGVAGELGSEDQRESPAGAAQGVEVETLEWPPALGAVEVVAPAGVVAIPAAEAVPDLRGESSCIGTSEVITWD